MKAAPVSWLLLMSYNSNPPVAQDHVVFAAARKVAEAHDLPIQSDRAERRGVGDVVVADVVDLECAGIAIARQHVGRVIAEKAAEAGNRPIGSDLTQLVAGQDRIVADIVDLVRAVATTQDHVGRGPGGRSRISTGWRRMDPM